MAHLDSSGRNGCGSHTAAVKRAGINGRQCRATRDFGLLYAMRCERCLMASFAALAAAAAWAITRDDHSVPSAMSLMEYLPRRLNGYSAMCIQLETSCVNCLSAYLISFTGLG